MRLIKCMRLLFIYTVSGIYIKIAAQQPLLELIEGTPQCYIWDIVQLMSELAYSSYNSTYKPRLIISPL